MLAATAVAQGENEHEAYEQLCAGELAFATKQYEDARIAFEAVVAMPKSGYASFAHARLAAIARYQGRAWEGLRHVRLAFEACRENDLTTPPAANAEFVRCHLDLGLADCVAVTSRDLLRANPLGSSMHAMALLIELDTCLALDDLRRVRSLARRTLGDPSIKTMDPLLVAKIRLRSLLADRELAVQKQELVRAATNIEDAVTTLDNEDQNMRTAKLIAADAWLDAGELDEVERILDVIAEEDALRAREDGRSLILRSRLARAQGEDREVLADLQRRLETVHEHWLAGVNTIPLRASGYGLLNDRAISATLATLTWLDAIVLEPKAAAAQIVARTEGLASLGTLSRRLACSAGTFSDVLALRPTDGGILLITLGPRTASIVVIDKQTSVHALTLDSGFWRDAARLARAVAQGPQAGADAGSVRALAERIATHLLPPAVAARIARWKSMLLVGSEHATELVQLMPWQGSWLCLQKAITHAPSVAVAKTLRQRAEKRAAQKHANDLALFANPTLTAATRARWGVAPLIIDAARIHAMSAPFDSERVITHVEDAATAAALADPRLHETRALCVLGHGAHNFEQERSACLLVHGPDPVASALDSVGIEGLRLPPLVLLGVCEAATGPLRQGDEGAQHLGGALLYAGADCVVLAPGRLALGATCDLLTACLREWRNGASVAEALRRARNEVATEPARSHPYFFAGMRAFGCDTPGLQHR